MPAYLILITALQTRLIVSMVSNLDLDFKVKTISVPKNCCRFLTFFNKYDELIISSTYIPTHLINPHPLSNLPTHPRDELISGQPPGRTSGLFKLKCVSTLSNFSTRQTTVRTPK